MLENLYHLSEALAVIFACLKAVRVFNRHENLYKDFPPHRHVNGKILYPRGFSPQKLEDLEQ